jgi:HAD superfamily hydrolase (TIGR01509 family)
MLLPEAVIFDMDGLLLDTERLSYRAWHEAAAKRGIEFPLEIFKRAVGKNWSASNALWREALGDGFDAEALRREKYEIEERISKSEGVVIRPGARELLMALKQGKVPVALATSTRRFHAEMRLHYAGVMDSLPIRVYGDEVEHAKPAPDIYLEAVRRLSVKESNSLALEDSDTGVEAAAAAGLQVIMVPDLIQPSSESSKRTKAICSDLFEVKNLLGI